MTAIQILGPVASPRRPWPEAALLVTGLAAVVVARLAATRAGLDPLAIGAGFATALGALALAGGLRLQIDRRLFVPVSLGLAFGIAIVVVGVAGAALGGATPVPGLGRPAAPFLPWTAITVVVAAAEEALLRGLLFDRIRRLGGVGPALIATSVVFALMHVPLYGWHVVPLDLAVGLGLGGLRLATRGIVAPAVAHAVADLATWWL